MLCYKHKAKFVEKIWWAISNIGTSHPLVKRVRGEALNIQSYINNCQTASVCPQTSCFGQTWHCAITEEISTQNLLRQHHIPFVLRNDNPPNLPQARLIEDFWALLSRKVYHGGWKAQKEKLKGRIYEKQRNCFEFRSETSDKICFWWSSMDPLHIVR